MTCSIDGKDLTPNAHLLIAPSVPVWIDGDFLVFDRKYYDGVLLYLKKWGSKVSCVMNKSDSKQPDFGVVSVRHAALPFNCIVLENKELISEEHIKETNIVLASADSFDQLHVSKLCKKLNIKCVYIIEYIPETRYQMVSVGTNNPILKLRRFLYVWNGERRRRAALSMSDGIQANGMPAYKEYKNHSNTLLYFDTRVNRSMYIAEKELLNRLKRLSDKSKPIRLAFSGRLTAVKGTDHLIELAIQLKALGVDCIFDIYGDGDQFSLLEKQIVKNNLGSAVVLHGSVSFNEVLLPEIQNRADIFICCHRQSDPSCTYMETLSCGVPILGYNNKALIGILELADVGWSVEMDDIKSLAKMVVFLDKNRDEVQTKSTAAYHFAQKHCFEDVYNERINHLSSIALNQDV